MPRPAQLVGACLDDEVHVVRLDAELVHAKALAVRLRDALAQLRDELALPHRRQIVDEAERHVLRMSRCYGLALVMRHAFACARPACAGSPAAVPHRAASLVEGELDMTLSLVLLRHD